MYYKDYDTYLQSPEWKTKALQRLAIDNYQCQMCGCEGSMWNVLNVHHLSYKNLYNEDVDKDLICLCDVCHRRIHKMMNRVTDHTTMKRGWSDQLPKVVQRHVYELANGVKDATEG